VAITGDGLQEALQWIAEMLNKRHPPGLKDFYQLLQMKAPSPKAEYKDFLSYLRKPWQLFRSLFIGFIMFLTMINPLSQSFNKNLFCFMVAVLIMALSSWLLQGF